MKPTNLLKSKRGIAIENAVIFMVVVFMLCSLLTSFTLMGFYQTKINTAELQEKLTIDQIGEDFLRKKNFDGTEYTGTHDAYSYHVDGNNLTVWRTIDESQTPVLTVKLSDNDDKKVDSWKYGAIEGE